MRKKNPFREIAKSLEATPEGRAAAIAFVGAWDPAAAERLRLKYRKGAARVALTCQECGKTWRVSPNAADPRCSKCGSVDWEVTS